MTGAAAARHYLDHAATTDVRPEAVAAFTDELARTGNAASSHGAGRASRRRLDDARENLADALGADPHEVILTAGGTEADNLAVKGAWFAARDARGHVPGVPIVVSAVEHDAVREAAAWLAAAEGARVRTLPVGGDCRVDLAELPGLLGAEGEAGAPALVAVMLANNETGAVQPLDAVVDAARRAGVPVHTDAVQALGSLDVHFHRLGVDSLAISGHKVGAPVGCGALLARRGLDLVPVEHGGGQERGVRSGTLPVAQARALAAAVRATVRERDGFAARAAALRARLVGGLTALREGAPDGSVLAGLRVSGPDEVGAVAAPGPAGSGAAEPGPAVLPTHVHVLHPGARSEAVLMGLDAAGIDASSGSACHAGVEQPSGVLLAMGVDPETARCALRLTLGHSSTDADVDAVLAALPGALEAAARAHPTARRAG